MRRSLSTIQLNFKFSDMGLFDRFKKKKERLQKKSERSAFPGKDLTLAQLKSAAEKDQGQGKVEPKAVKKVVKEDTKDAYRVLLKPLVTEKGTYLGAANKYLFAVSPKVNKIGRLRRDAAQGQHQQFKRQKNPLRPGAGRDQK